MASFGSDRSTLRQPSDYRLAAQRIEWTPGLVESIVRIYTVDAEEPIRE
jgi:hypothetical protein